MDSENCKVGRKRMRRYSDTKPSVIFSAMDSIQHPQQASDMECEVVGHSVEVESSGVGNVPSNGEEPTCCVEAAETNIPTLCDSMENPVEMKRHETKTLDDTSDIDPIIHQESTKISVKILRVVVPRLRVVCYSKEEEICGKKKMKNLWNDRPIDWPSQVPFKDPNNKGQEGRKATKEELVAMFEFLREKYLSMPRQCAVEEVYSPDPEPQLSQNDVVKEEPTDAMYYQHPSPPRVVETPFRQLLERLEDKANRLLTDVNDEGIISLVKQVFDDILVPLFKQSAQMAAGCEFLDAGHQLETLLDVGLAYGKETMHVLNQGCQELIDKFYPARDAGTQSAPVVQTYTVLNPTPNPISLAPATGDHWGLNLRPNVTLNNDLVRQSIVTRTNQIVTVGLNNDEKDDLLKTAVDQSGIKMEASEVFRDVLDEVLDMQEDHKKELPVESMEFHDAPIEVQTVNPPQAYSFSELLNSDSVFLNSDKPLDTYINQEQQQPSLVLAQVGPCSPPMGSPQMVNMGSPQGAIPTTVEEMDDQRPLW